MERNLNHKHRGIVGERRQSAFGKKHATPRGICGIDLIVTVTRRKARTDKHRLLIRLTRLCRHAVDLFEKRVTTQATRQTV
jgi:hypothetical protein